MNWPGMVVGCRGPRRQGRTSSSDYVTPVTAAPCGCTPDCLQPITHRSSRDSCHFPFLRVRKRVARLPIPPSLHRTLQLADPPPPQLLTTPPATTSSASRSRWRNNRLQRRATHNHPRSRFSYASNRPATAITFARKYSACYEAQPGLTLQRASSDQLFSSTFLCFPFLVLFCRSFYSVLVCLSFSILPCRYMLFDEHVCRVHHWRASRPKVLFPWIDKIISLARYRTKKREWNETTKRRIDEKHTVAMQ